MGLGPGQTGSAGDAILPFPVPGDRVKCGLRADLPKKERRHNWVSLGTDTRNRGSRGFLDCEILACLACGTDKALEPLKAREKEAAS